MTLLNKFILKAGIIAVLLLCARSDRCQTATCAATLNHIYGSTPKGLVLEGKTSGIGNLTHISYNNAQNSFLLNRTTNFPVKVSKKELIDILLAIAEDDRLGVSFTPSGKLLVYGKITPQSDAVIALAKADRLLVSVIFGWEKNLRGIKLPGGWMPEGRYERELPAISVNKFEDYRMTLSNGTYYRTGIRMINLLLPMSDRTAENGGYLADPGRAKISAADQNNLNFLRAHASEFIKIPELKHAADIGEVAAFARFLRDTGSLNLKKLAEHIKKAK